MAEHNIWLHNKLLEVSVRYMCNQVEQCMHNYICFVTPPLEICFFLPLHWNTFYKYLTNIYTFWLLLLLHLNFFLSDVQIFAFLDFCGFSQSCHLLISSGFSCHFTFTFLNFDSWILGIVMWNKPLLNGL